MAVTQLSAAVVPIRKRGNPGVIFIIHMEPAASVKFLKGLSYAIDGDIAKKQDIMQCICAIVLTPMFRNVIVPVGRGLGARTV